MGRGKKYQPEQVVNLPRQIEVAVGNGKPTAQACREAGIVEQTYYRWRKEYAAPPLTLTSYFAQPRASASIRGASGSALQR